MARLRQSMSATIWTIPGRRRVRGLAAGDLLLIDPQVGYQVDQDDRKWMDIGILIAVGLAAVMFIGGRPYRPRRASGR